MEFSVRRVIRCGSKNCITNDARCEMLNTEHSHLQIYRCGFYNQGLDVGQYGPKRAQRCLEEQRRALVGPAGTALMTKECGWKMPRFELHAKEISEKAEKLRHEFAKQHGVHIDGVLLMTWLDSGDRYIGCALRPDLPVWSVGCVCVKDVICTEMQLPSRKTFRECDWKMTEGECE